MAWICPECMGPLESADGQQARCTIHGGEYRVLFSHWQRPAPPQASPASAEMSFGVAPGAVCFQHQSSPAAFSCQSCGTPMCEVCAFQEGGLAYCPNCMMRRSRPVDTADWDKPIIPAGVFCVQHRTVAPTQKCKACGAYMCATCDFTLPGGIHVCPACATAPRSDLSPRRKKLMLGSLGLALVATIGLALLMAGAFAGLADSKEAQDAVGVAIMFFVLLPSVAGMALGFSAKDRNLANPPLIWIGLVWNLIIVGCFLLLMVIGLMK